MSDDTQDKANPALRAPVGSAESEMAALLVRWKDRILRQAATNIENHFIDAPVEDFTAEEEGFERGLQTAVDEVCRLMADPSHFGRAPQNTEVGGGR